MSFWEHLFDDDHKQRRDINMLRAGAEGNESLIRAQADRITDLEVQNDRLSLVVEALVELLRVKGQVSTQELALAIQRIDLSDGYEDGRLGPDLRGEAPACASCSRPVNPARGECIFCGAAYVEAHNEPPPPRMTSCAQCRKDVPERSTWFTERGSVCTECYHNPAGEPGGLSLSDDSTAGGVSLAGGDGGLSLE